MSDLVPIHSNPTSHDQILAGFRLLCDDRCCIEFLYNAQICCDFRPEASDNFLLQILLHNNEDGNDKYSHGLEKTDASNG